MSPANSDGVIGAPALWLVREVVAAHVGRDHVVAGLGQRPDLVTPGVPELGEAVQQDHQRPGAGLDVVQSDAAADIRIAVAELCLDRAHIPIVDLAVRSRCHLVVPQA